MKHSTCLAIAGAVAVAVAAVYIQCFFLEGVIIAMDIVTTSCESISGKLQQMEVTTSFPETMHLYSSFAFAAVPGEEEENASFPALFCTQSSLPARTSFTAALGVGAAQVLTPTNCGDSSPELSSTSTANGSTLPSRRLFVMHVPAAFNVADLQ